MLNKICYIKINLEKILKFSEVLKMIFRRAYADEIEKIITLQSNIFHTEQGIPEDDVAEFLSRNPIC